MQHIKIYDQLHNSQSQKCSNAMIIGVHSYTSFLAEFSHKKNIKILLQGNIKQITQNILWNQFYSYTLLKDIQRTLFSQAELKNSFLKVNGKTYRLSQCLQWTNNQKIGNELIKNPYFSIQCFMFDSSIKFISVQFGNVNHNGYDLVFQYLSHYKSMKCSLNNYSTINSLKKQSIQTLRARGKTNNNFKNTVAIKSLFVPERKNQHENTNKFLTQKKNWQQKPKITKNDVYQRKRSNTKTNKSKMQQKQNDVLSIKSSSNNMSYEGRGSNLVPNQNKRQALTATILHKKEQKIKEYQTTLQQKQKQYEDRLRNIEKSHEEEVSAIKLQVKQVLNNYKKKNKELKKQNQCLMEINHKLTITNKKLQDRLEEMNEKMSRLSEGQQKIQKNNIQYSLKLSNIQNANTKLVQKLSQQESYYKSQISEKDKVTYELKTKYDRLLGHIKLVAVQEKQNMI